MILRHRVRSVLIICPSSLQVQWQEEMRDTTHWSCRKLAAALGVSKDAVRRVWREAGLRPHRLECYMASNDPDFEAKAADIIGLYLNPPQHAAVFGRTPLLHRSEKICII
jgi:hypothetical protein